MAKSPEAIAGGYGLLFTIVFVLDLLTSWKDPWSFLVFAMSFPCSMLLMFVAAWSLAHSGYPLDYFFIPCALINGLCIFWLARKAIPRRQ